jgi:hypothetical protein
VDEEHVEVEVWDRFEEDEDILVAKGKLQISDIPDDEDGEIEIDMYPPKGEEEDSTGTLTLTVIFMERAPEPQDQAELQKEAAKIIQGQWRQKKRTITQVKLIPKPDVFTRTTFESLKLSLDKYARRIKKEFELVAASKGDPSSITAQESCTLLRRITRFIHFDFGIALPFFKKN